MYISKLSPRDMIVLSLLIICVIVFALLGWFKTVYVENDVINVALKDGVTKEVVFKKMDIAPGESCEYTLILEHEEFVEYDVVFEFEETENLDLKKYVYVKMEVDGNVFCDKLLADVFNEESIHLHVDPTITGSGDIKITYYLPQDVGNEAQKTKTAFKLLVTASSKETMFGEER